MNKSFGKKIISIIAALAVAISFMPVTGLVGFASAAEAWTDMAPVVTVSSADSYLKVSWDKLEGAKGYKVYRATSESGKYSVVKTTTGSYYKDKKVKTGKKYFYKVKSYIVKKKKKIYGPASEPMAGIRTLAAPANVKAALNTENKSQATVKWDKVKGADGYQILRTEVDEDRNLGTFEPIGESLETNYTDSTGEPGKKYCYKVCGYADLNGEKSYGKVNSLLRRDKVLQVAIAWEGYNDGGKGKSHKEIINVYNSVNPPGGRISYSASWCAAYVSAVAIKANARSIMPLHSCCPTMLSKYKKKKRYTSKRGYIPKPGDVTFYDWERNGVPNHVGIVVEADESHVKVIEGNTAQYRRQGDGLDKERKGDGVAYRTYDPATFKLVQGYGLPKYRDTTVVFAESALDEAEVPLGSSLNDDVIQVACAESTEMEAVEDILQCVQEESAGNETEDAFQVYEMCNELDITASVITVVYENGEETSWDEVVIDGENYIVNITKEDNQITEFSYLQ